MAENKEIELAFNFLQYTDRNIFLTGRAGTGKTTFLKSLKTRLFKRFVVLAPTGVAALNAGGVTIHSFFQLPFHAFVPGAKFETRKFSKQKRNLINSLDLIIIDEVSMVRCDVLDAIDRILRKFRRNGAGKPFGGVQLLLIGDLNQLPPIANDNEEQMLKTYYDSIYFFSSKALLDSNYITIALKHIYRQSDEKFIQILNAVRDNRLTEEDVAVLNQSYKKDILENVPENYIVLCTHNLQADKINVNKINALKGMDKIYKAQIEGIFPDNIYPNLENLHLKTGSQVMFLKNDYENGEKKRYYNGKIGIVTELDDEFVKVKCPDDEQEIFVRRYTWQNFEYSMDKDTKELKLKEKGTFTQFPLKLAWAITIHKSQGLTFDKAIINSNQAFSHGQVYVALSRCRSLEGMILSEPFKYSSIILDRNIKIFNDNALEHSPDDLVLQKSKDDYFFKTLYSVFDFTELSRQMSRLQGFVNTTISKVFPKLSEIITQQTITYFKDVDEVSLKFKKYFDSVCIKNISAEEKMGMLLKRSYDARDYFLKHLSVINNVVLSLLDIELDNKEENSLLKELTVQISVEKEIKVRLLDFLDEKGFQIDQFLKYKNNILAQGIDIELSSIITEKKKTKKQSSKSKKTKKQTDNKAYNDIEDKELFDILRDWRKETAEEDAIPVYMVLSQAALIEIANKKPQTMKELLDIKGVGRQKAERYGQNILDIVADKK